MTTVRNTGSRIHNNLKYEKGVGPRHSMTAYCLSCSKRYPYIMTGKQGKTFPPIRSGETFEKYIWQNNCVCNNCFRLLKEKFAFTFFGGFIDHKGEYHYRTNDSEIGYDMVEPPANSITTKPIAKPKVTCRGCGSVGGNVDPQTLSKKAALKRVPRLQKRLEEQGFEVDGERMWEVVFEAKSCEPLQGFDREIFGAATRLSAQKPRKIVEAV